MFSYLLVNLAELGFILRQRLADMLDDMRLRPGHFSFLGYFVFPAILNKL